MDVVLWAVIGYAAGALPSAYLVTIRAGRADVAERVRRNAGEGDAHVLLKEAGAGRAAAGAATLDVLKAFLPVLAAVRSEGPYAAAACGIAAVAGHCWPPLYRRFAGRGLAAAAGAFLVLLPVEMVAAGAVTGLGILSRVGGIASTIGFGSVPVIAALRHQPFPYRLMAWTILALVVARRLEGVSEDEPGARAVLRRALFDVSRPGARGAERAERAGPPG